MIRTIQFAKLFLLLTVMILTGYVASAQEMDSYVPPSPNAASLGIFGDVPISEYTGIPQIGVPLYDIKSNGISASVSLSYFAGGIRAKDEASWVGLAWALNCGGVITRTKRDKDDFASNGYFRSAHSASPSCGNQDLEPDIFYYNFGNFSGKFIIDHSNSAPGYTIRLFKKDNLQIVYSDLNALWIITAADGTRYTFSNPENTTETQKYTSDGNTDHFSVISTETYVSSWYLVAIQSPEGANVYFTYDNTTKPRIVRSYQSLTSTQTISYTPSWVGTSCCPFNFPISGGLSETDISTDEILLQSVSFNNGYIGFSTSPRTDVQLDAGSPSARKLDKMIIYKGPNASSPVLKEFDFNYDYYNTGSGRPAYFTTRLRLRSITEVSGNVSKPPYSFTYNDDKLVDKASQDGTIGTLGLIQQLTYPTGGSNTFTFASNGYGAIVTRVIANDPNNVTNVKRYEYTNGRVMGTRMVNISYTATQNTVLQNSSCCPGVISGNTTASVATKYTFYEDFSSLGDVGSGVQMAYDEVTTYYGDNGENGKTESHFINQVPTVPNYPFNIGGTPIPIAPDVSNKNGLLTDAYVYANQGGNYVLLKSTHNDYQSVGATQTSIQKRWNGGCNGYIYTVTTEWIQQTDQIVNTYDQTGNNPVANMTYYYYDNADNVLPTRIQMADSKNNTILTTNVYPESEPQGGVYTTMINKYMIGDMVENSVSSNGNLLSKMKTNYRDWFGDGKVIKPETIEVQKGTTNETRVRYYSYDRDGNNQEFSKEKGEHIYYIWGYNSQYPIAEVKNASFQAPQTAQNAEFVTGISLDLRSYNSTVTQDVGSFSTTLAQTFNFTVFMTYTNVDDQNGFVVLIYDQNGVQQYSNTYSQNGSFNASIPLAPGTYRVAIQYTGSSGDGTISFTIDGTYQIGIAHPNIFHTSFEEEPTAVTSDSKTGARSLPGPYTMPMPTTNGSYVASWWQKPSSGGTWVYHEQIVNVTGGSSPDLTMGDNSSLIDEVRLYPVGALMSTYTYDPLTGITSSCGPDSKANYYEYDVLGRLLRIRDQDRNILQEYTYHYQEQPQ